MFTRLLSLLICCSIATAPVVAAAPKIINESEHSLYSVVKEEYLPGLAHTPPPPPELDANGKPTKPVDLKVRQLSDEECKLLAFDLLAHKNDMKDNGFIMKNTREDLEVFKGSNLLKTLKRTRTSFGEAVLGTMLLNAASTNPRASQQTVRTLVENKDLFLKIDDSLKDFAQAEKLFLAYYLPIDPAKENYLKELYFNGWLSSKMFDNENPHTLEFFTHLDGLRQSSKIVTGQDAVIVGGVAIGYGVLGRWAHNVLQRIPAHPLRGHPIEMVNRALGQNPDANLGSTIAKTIFFSMLPISTLYVLVKNYLGMRPEIPALAGMVLGNENIPTYGFLLFSALFAWQWFMIGKDGYTNLTRQIESTRYLQSHLIACSSAIRALEQIRSTVRGENSFTTAIPELAAIDKLQTQNDKIAKLVSLLNTKTFEGSPSYFSNLGRVLVAHRLMAEHCRSLRDAFEAVGKLDAFMSAAKLYKDHQAMPVK